ITILLVTICFANASKQKKNGVLPWMGLQRTNESIASDLEEIESISNLLSAVAFERFNLGPNSTLILNNFTDVIPTIKSYGLQTLPMISTCCPWGRPEVIEYARELFRNPQPFITSAVQYALDEGFNGYSVDIEPVGGNAQDAEDYANFVDMFANELHAFGKILTVCAATYDPFWNLTLLGRTQVDLIYTMNTYASNLTTFTQQFQFSVESIPLNKLAIGLMTVGDNNEPFSDAELQARFDMINSAKISNIGIWDAPIPSAWFPFLKQYVVDVV
ncbi:hypothetical protein SAMD00019534_065450, partial [Acytostelium subglobosum LB1]|uniref:hypothetical protein n=1 Tax=Acytostelium subglobosum LB1 TaxID=1410327 RepID=UPI000644E666